MDEFLVLGRKIFDVLIDILCLFFELSQNYFIWLDQSLALKLLLISCRINGPRTNDILGIKAVLQCVEQERLVLCS